MERRTITQKAIENDNVQARSLLEKNKISIEKIHW